MLRWFVYAIQNQFSKVRSFVFIDGIDEVTKYFKSTEDIGEAINRVNTEADVVWVDGHSDYGHAFEVFWERYGKDINSKTTVLLLGDARNNYHAAQSWVVKEIAKRARHVYWLTSELHIPVVYIFCVCVGWLDNRDSPQNQNPKLYLSQIFDEAF